MRSREDILQEIDDVSRHLLFIQKCRADLDDRHEAAVTDRLKLLDELRACYP